MAEAGSQLTDQFSRLNTDYTVVVAIDFGTTYSGYSFSFKSSPSDIFTRTNWGEKDGIPSIRKTPTCVLTDYQNTFVAIGFDAQKKYRMLTPDEAQYYRFYSEFKMKLHSEKSLSKDTLIEDQTGYKAPAIDIFAMVLGEMKTMMLATQGGINLQLIRWVITVPAIWTDSAKQFMKEAAVKAGLVDNIDSGKLLIALEPEAASICCQQLPLADFEMSGANSSTLAVGSQYLVLDAGGGTLDITAHKVLPDNNLEELYFANGGPLGSVRVNDNMLCLLDRIFQHKFVEIYRRKNPGDYNSLVNALEAAKKGFRPHEDRKTTISLTMGMSEVYEEEFGQKLSKSISTEYTSRGVKIQNGLLCIPHDVMASVFQNVVGDIMSHVEGLLGMKALRGVTTILMVGGFSHCEVLQARN
uniref:Heat shock protein family A member 12 variant X13 n=1 Tax=Urechis unicinctus TaxID=6432 RepID=A0AAU0MV74_UREUN